MGQWCIFGWSTAGKWGRAVSILEGEQTAREVPKIEEAWDSNANDVNSQLNVCTMELHNRNHIMLYSVGHETVTRTMHNTNEEVLFKHTLQLLGPKGEVVRVSALFDGAAMVAAMCQSVFEKVKHRLGGWRKSEKQLWMVNRVLVPLQVVWKGVMQLGGIEVEGSFEVFDSGENWAFLLGKPLLCWFNAEQDFFFGHSYHPPNARGKPYNPIQQNKATSIKGRDTGDETLTDTGHQTSNGRRAKVESTINSDEGNKPMETRVGGKDTERSDNRMGCQ